MSWSGIAVYIENYGRGLTKTSFELLGKAREIVTKVGGPVYAIMLSNEEIEKYVNVLVAYGADEVVVYRVEDKELPNILVHKCSLVDAISQLMPKLVLFPATPWGRSLAPRVAASLGAGLTADCLDVYVDDGGGIVQVRPAFTGNIIAHIKTVTYPVMATIRPGVFPVPTPDSSRKGRVIERTLNLKVCPSAKDGYRVLGLSREKKVKIQEAKVIISIGRGVRSREDIKLFEELAEELSAQLACSRPLVDVGWMEKDFQVGFSGNIVKPKVYIALGISGAPQHIAGMKDSGLIISVNIDPSAPIAKYSDIFVIGDMYEFAKKFLEAVKTSKSGESRVG